MSADPKRGIRGIINTPERVGKPEVMTALKQVENGRRILKERGVDMAAARMALKSLHPQLKPLMLDTVLAMEAVIASKLQAPFTADSVAEQLANESGAFPWHGPVGNGLTVSEYQSRFREIADEHLFIGRQMGLIP